MSQKQVDKRILDLINSVSYDTLVSIKKAVQIREGSSSAASSSAAGQNHHNLQNGTND